MSDPVNSEDGRLGAALHARVFAELVAPESRLSAASSQVRPRAIILAGQPAAGKSGLARAVEMELKNDLVRIDPDELSDYHPYVGLLRIKNPYTWHQQTHPDARQWAAELREVAVARKKNLVIDTTLGSFGDAAALVEHLQANGYDVEIRAMATHRLESELNVDQRFGRFLHTDGYGRYVQKEFHEQVYHDLPFNLDLVHAETGTPIKIYSREGKRLYDSRHDDALPSKALEDAREQRLTNFWLTRELRNGYRKQVAWHKNLPRFLAKRQEPSA